MIRKIWSLIIATTLIFTVFGSLNIAKAETNFMANKIPDNEIEFLTGSTLDGYNYIELSEPVTENYDGVYEVLIGYYIEENLDEIKKLDNYREYDTYLVYDQGITQSWSWLSRPYFIMSVARGMSYESSIEVSATISGTFSSDIPSKALPTVKSSFGFSASGSKKITEKVVLSGPNAGYSSRDFYYKQGRHTHRVKIVQERRSNWDGVLWTKTYYGSVGKPAIKHYSVDRK